MLFTSITTNSTYQELLERHFLQNIDSLRINSPDVGIVILSDFNRMNINSLTRGNYIVQIIDFHTRKDATRLNINQGTILGQIGFQTFINDAVQDANSKCLKYVDDCTLVENRPISRNSSFKVDLIELVVWSDKHRKAQLGKPSPYLVKVLCRPEKQVVLSGARKALHGMNLYLVQNFDCKCPLIFSF